MERSFKHKIVIITGGASGIGRALGNLFAQNGAQVGLLDQDEESVEKCAANLRKRGLNAIGIRCDVTNESACRHALESTRIKSSQNSPHF